MVPVMDNALYHHVRGIPYLATLSKKSTGNLMKDHGIEYVLLLLTNEQISILPKNYNCTINNGHLQIPFNEEKLQKRKTKSIAFENPSAEELKVATVVWMKHHKPIALLCKV